MYYTTPNKKKKKKDKSFTPQNTFLCLHECECPIVLCFMTEWGSFTKSECAST
jgi:hypothetical protein